MKLDDFTLSLTLVCYPRQVLQARVVSLGEGGR